MTERYVGTGDVARAIGVHVRTVARWFDRGYLHGYKTPGGVRRILQSEIRRFLGRPVFQ